MRGGIALIAAMSVFGFGVVGCTSKPRQPVVATAHGSASAGGDSAAPSDDPARRERQLIECMRREGTQVADPVAGEPPGNVIRHELDERGKGTDEKFQAALEKCSRYLPNVSTSSAPSNAADIAKRREFAKCMREHGVPDFPDPDPETGHVVYAPQDKGPIGKITRAGDGIYLSGDSPALAAALEQCRSVLPPAPEPTGTK